MTRLCLALALAALGCKDSSNGTPPYTPEPRSEVEDAGVGAAAPIDASDGLLGEDHTVVECVNDCVRSRQMRAESIESIRRGCARRCERRCRRSCLERSKQRGLSAKGLRSDCANTCRFD
jgi:hypothetical protein